MGTPEYLKSLNLDQLKWARDFADYLIKEKESDKKLVVWCVEDSHMRLDIFPDADYLKAADYLLVVARENAQSPQKLSASDKALHLVPLRVLESEYSDYVTVKKPKGA